MGVNLDEITRALGERKKGDWTFCRYAETDREWLKAEVAKLLDNDGAGDVCYFVGTEDDLVVALTGNGPTSAANAHLIANAPDWLRLLVERVRKLEAVAEKSSEIASELVCYRNFKFQSASGLAGECLSDAIGLNLDMLIKSLVSANVPGWEK
jgi:hypothetical protein